ncbi:hypothetical protein [Rhizocola hellebori]|uniref:hypothetical protein n=1 Tax=Rhizocola hellebori TaxID=1392758 RepID=UPI001943ECD8|nr:hypothetical protein [Rhizocola hellebori]
MEAVDKRGAHMVRRRPSFALRWMKERWDSPKVALAGPGLVDRVIHNLVIHNLLDEVMQTAPGSGPFSSLLPATRIPFI